MQPLAEVAEPVDLGKVEGDKSQPGPPAEVRETFKKHRAISCRIAHCIKVKSITCYCHAYQLRVCLIIPTSLESKDCEGQSG